MSDIDRFVEFLVRVADAYHRPPVTPSDRMWAGVERGLAGSAVGSPVEGRSKVDPIALAASAYHAPPITPHDDMWTRIDAAWELRRGAPPAARDAGLPVLDPAFETGEPATAPGERSRAVVSLTLIAIAVSLVVGIVIGRASLGSFITGGARVATSGAPPETAVGDPVRGVDPEAATAGGVPGGPAEGRPVRQVELAGPVAGLGPEELGELETGVRVAAADREPTTTVRGGSPARAPVDPGATGRREAAVQYATVRHFSRVETLLTTFKTQDGPGDEGRSLSVWARELLGDTRLLLDAPAERSEQELRLLEDLELVLAEIAGLEPGTGDFERGIVRDGIERGGTISRLRAAAPPGATRMITGT